MVVAGVRRSFSMKRTATGGWCSTNRPHASGDWTQVALFRSWQGGSIVGATVEESDALIEQLKGYMIQPEAAYRHRWRKGDIVIWDNRCSYHKAAGDYPPGVEAQAAAE
jgi:hypothetical protein